METQELVNALKRRGHPIGPSAISHDGALLLNVDGRLIQQVDAEELYIHGEELLSSIDILVRQGEQLIEKFGIEITHAPAATYGSERYIKAVHTYDRLSRAEVQLGETGNIAKWQQATVDGRDGSEIVRRLGLIKRLLQQIGEGARQGNVVASN